MKKHAKRGTGWPSAFEHPLDRKDPYQRYQKPNSGNPVSLVLLGNQGLPGEPPDTSGSIGGASTTDSVAMQPHPYAESDPEDPFRSVSKNIDGVLQYGEDGSGGIDFTSTDSPVGKNRRVFDLLSENRDSKWNQISGNISKKRKIK